MHSRIFQLSLEPINSDDYIASCDYSYGHWFTKERADYVSDCCSREDDIERLQVCHKGILFDEDDNGKYLIVRSREEYFADDYKNFKEYLDKLNNYPLSEFATGLHEIWSLNNAYEDKHGFYADVDGELLTFDEFIRVCALNEKYYIGGTVDYHF